MASQTQQRSSMAETEEMFIPVEFKMQPADGEIRPSTKEIDLTPEVTHLFGLPEDLDATVRAATKTMRFQGKLATTTGQPVATLDNVTVTATKMTNPQTGLPFINVTLDYLATTHGFRTGRGSPTGEPLGMPQGLYFHNSAGGTIHSWGFPRQEFILGCDWNRRHCFHRFEDKTYVGWFDLWQGVQHRVNGVVFHC